jgi:hypothetical protein
MIGDRKHDIIGANTIGIDSIGVTYGYGSLEELSHANPTHIIEQVDQLQALSQGRTNWQVYKRVKGTDYPLKTVFYIDVVF